MYLIATIILFGNRRAKEADVNSNIEYLTSGNWFLETTRLDAHSIQVTEKGQKTNQLKAKNESRENIFWNFKSDGTLLKKGGKTLEKQELSSKWVLSPDKYSIKLSNSIENIIELNSSTLKLSTTIQGVKQTKTFKNKS